MPPPTSRLIDNKKFMWDGATYPDEAEASRVAETYRGSGFEAHVATDEGVWLVFTRREAAAEAARG